MQRGGGGSAGGGGAAAAPAPALVAVPLEMAVALALALTVALWLAPEPAGGGRVLALFQLNHHSHFAMFETLMKALAAKGHQVDVLSHFPQKTPLPNYRDLSVKGALPDPHNTVSVQNALSYSNSLASLNFFWVQNLEMCEEVGSYVVGDRSTEQLLRRHFGPTLPSLAELQRNVSLVLVNSHFSLNQARPSVPALVEVAGMHIAEPRPLPEDLLRFVEGAKEGVVYMSFGSLVRSETLPETRLRFVAEELEALPQRVVWKLNATDLPFALPPNVYARPWLPQADILAHPNVRLFITHGGLMGTQEAVHWGVPMVVVPFFGDQHLNARNYVQRGLAVRLDSAAFTREQLRDALRTVLGDSSYRENARRLSEQFRDRPQAPLETAVW
ncbi:UDP-glucuronosyltransferase, partial [Gryllus bimaculatus]